MTSARYAIYFAPDPASELWRRGSRWLGRDAATGQPMARPALAGPAVLQTDDITKSPATYGFHATLKPPFRLAAGQTRDSLLRAAAVFAQSRASVVLAGLRVAVIGKFVALAPGGNERHIGELANGCVVDFDRFRAPLDADERSPRRQASLTPRQAELVERWDYPYVMEEFRFHMTLTGPLAADDREPARKALKAHFADLIAKPITIDAIAVFEQTGSDRPFRIVERFPLTGG